MSTRAIVFAAAIMAGSLFASSALAVQGTTTGDAPLRVGPGDEFAKIGAIDAGSTLKIHSCREGQVWCLVRVNGRSGWVPGELVKAGGGFSKAKSYYDPTAKVSLQYDVNDREFFDDTLLDPRGVPMRRFRRFRGDRAFDPRGFPMHPDSRFRGDGVFGAHDFRMHPHNRFLGNRVFGVHSFPVRPFSLIDRARLSDKQLPNSFRSTIHTPGFRLHKQGFPNFIDN